MLSFPLSLADFNDGLRVVSQDFDLSENRRVTETGGGELLVSDLGPRLWRGAIEVAANTHAGQRKAQALAQALRQGAATFMVCDRKGRFPAADPTGALLGATTPSLFNPVADSPDVTLAGLPSGYVLPPGDYLAFPYGSPTRHALHQIVVGATAAGTGRATVTVVPSIRPGATNGAPVSLVNPSCRAMLVPGSFRAGTQTPAAHGGFSFEWRQVLR